jgi:hypothetical protein
MREEPRFRGKPSSIAGLLPIFGNGSQGRESFTLGCYIGAREV